MRKRKLNRRLELDLEVPFALGVERVPERERPGLRAWLRQWRRQPARVFWELDVVTGEWRRM
jgi:hypothetical protein